MRVAVTGGTGFLGQYILKQLAASGHSCRAWYRTDAARDQVDDGGQVDWLPGTLNDNEAGRRLLEGCDAVIHSALHHPGGGFRGGEGPLSEFVETNVVGTIRLIEQALAAEVPRFVFISTCAVHEIILPDRRLDEEHPLWPTSHYGAHKAAIEKFIHSYGLGHGYEICSLRPTGIYGLMSDVRQSKWFDLVQRVARGEQVEVSRGGKEVHAADVARAAELLLSAPGIAGQAYNCYDRYISEYDVATTAKQISGSSAEIVGQPRQPMNQIETGKLRELGMEFGGWTLFESTVGQMLDEVMV